MAIVQIVLHISDLRTMDNTVDLINVKSTKFQTMKVDVKHVKMGKYPMILTETVFNNM